MNQLSPAWRPTKEVIANANLTEFMTAGGFHYYEDFHRWTVLDPTGFWGGVIDRLGIVFSRAPDRSSKAVLRIHAGCRAPG